MLVLVIKANVRLRAFSSRCLSNQCTVSPLYEKRTDLGCLYHPQICRSDYTDLASVGQDDAPNLAANHYDLVVSQTGKWSREPLEKCGPIQLQAHDATRCRDLASAAGRAVRPTPSVKLGQHALQLCVSEAKATLCQNVHLEAAGHARCSEASAPGRPNQRQSGTDSSHEISNSRVQPP